MVGQIDTAASQALVHGDRPGYELLLSLVQEALIGGGWSDIESVLEHCFALGAAAGSGRHPTPISPGQAGTVQLEPQEGLHGLLAQLEEVDEAREPVRVISLCERILALLRYEDNPRAWAGLMAMLAAALVRNPAHDPAEDIGRAVGCCQAALTVFGPDDTPAEWVMVQDLLATAYCQWAEGDHGDNIEQALNHSKLALKIGKGRLPAELLAGMHNNIAAAFLERTRKRQERNIKSAIKHLKTALGMYGDPGSPPLEEGLRSEWARAQDNLGRAYAARLRGDPASNSRKAIACFEQALVVRTRESFPADFAVTMANFGSALADSPEGERAENIDKSIGCYEAALLALAECPRADWPPNWGLLVQRLSGSYAARLLGDPVRNARHAIGFLESARPELLPESSAAGGIPRSQRVDEAHILVALGRAYASPQLRNLAEYADNLERGIQYLTSALALYDREAMPAWWASALNSLGSVYADRVYGDRADNLRHAITSFEDALTVYTLDAFPLDRAATLHNVGAACADLATATASVSERAQSLSRSIDCYTESLDTFRMYGERARCLTTAWELGKACADAQRWVEASRAYQEAVEAAEVFYAASLMQEAKEAELTHVFGLYQDTGYALARSGQLTEAVITLEQGRSRALNESLARDRADLSIIEEDKPTLASAYREAADRVSELERRQRQFANISGHPLSSLMAPMTAVRPATTNDLRDEVQTVQNELHTVIEQIQAEFPQLLPAPGWPEICATVAPEQPVVYLAVTHHGGLALVLHAQPANGSQPNRAPGIAVQPIFAGDDAGRLLQQLGDLLITVDANYQVTGGYLPGQVQQKATWMSAALAELLPLLGERMISPLAKYLTELGASGVTLLAGPPLGLLPLHAATYTKHGHPEPLLNQFNVSYAPSARVLGKAHATAVTRGTRPRILAGVADPPHKALPRLPFARAEVSEAASYFGADDCHVLAPDHATSGDIKRATANASYVHLACHGEFNPDNPLRSRFFLAAGTELTLDDILTEQPFHTARLVVMSACQTALTDIWRLPDEAIGLPAGILQSGVPGVIGTLWPVADLVGALVMTRFYQYHLRGHPDAGGAPLSPPAALSQAQRWIAQATCREIADSCLQHPAIQSSLHQTGRHWWLEGKDPAARPFEHPLYWAPFVFVGA
jgi:CHAT domain-containing protein/tetratricopeptide (TPR) repeat protein